MSIGNFRKHPGLACGGAAVLLLLGATAIGIVIRFWFGLGAVTNLSDTFPWGLWIGFDVMAGVALAAGGFIAAFVAHIMRVERYEVHVRGAILAAFLGYVFVVGALMIDLGRPWSIYNALLFPNFTSVLTEVGWCVFFYNIVLAIEFSPIILRRFNLVVPLRLINRIFIVFVIAGIVLSTLHQSSLGALYLIARTKLHPLWYTSALPYFFLATAIAVGLSMLIIEATIFVPDPRSRTRRVNVRELGEYAAVLLLGYLFLRLADLVFSGRAFYAFGLTMETLAISVELGLGVLVPAILLLWPAVQCKPYGPFTAAWMVVGGVVFNRYNVAVTGMLGYAGPAYGMTPLQGPVYLPSIWEILITAGLVAAEVIIFLLAMKYIVIPDEEREHREAARAKASGGPLAAGKA